MIEDPVRRLYTVARTRPTAPVARLVALLIVSVLAALPASASAKPITQRVEATVIFKSDRNPTDLSNCGTVALLQWKDPTANRFVATRWEAHYTVDGREIVKSTAPPFNNKISWMGVDHIATDGNNWLQLWAAWGSGFDPTVPAPEASCAEFRSQTEQKLAGPAWVIVTGEEDKSDTAKCNKARTTYNTARKNVNIARKKLAAAKSKAAKSRLTHQLNSAIKARARAAAAVGKACS